ncbi:MAG TPA: hypothetical protein VGG75_42645 [Trebonia sp.]|jgi:hypothetical protein
MADTTPDPSAAPAPAETTVEDRLKALEEKASHYEELFTGFLSGPGAKIARAFGFDVPKL